MTTGRPAEIGDFFAGTAPGEDRERLAEGAVLLRGYALAEAPALAAAVDDVAAISPFRHMVTPGGFRMSVAMTSCGEAGWVTDRSGYRYSRRKIPLTGRPWPAMPAIFRSLAARAAASAGFAGFIPDACLINRYEPETKLSLHRDEDERDMSAPVVSVSLGLPAVFLWGGLSRKERPAAAAAGERRCRRLGRPGPARLSRHRPSRRRRAPADRPQPGQFDLSTGALSGRTAAARVRPQRPDRQPLPIGAALKRRLLAIFEDRDLGGNALDLVGADRMEPVGGARQRLRPHPPRSRRLRHAPLPLPPCARRC